MAVETAGLTRPFQAVAIHARKFAAVRSAGLVREQRSSAAGAGSCGPSVSHDRRQRAASLSLPRPKTFQQGNWPTASREWRLQKLPAFDAIRANIKGTQARGQKR